MKTTDEIKKGLELCYEGIDCSECPYVDDCFGNDETPFGVVMPDALALIRQLEADLEDMTARYKIADDCAKKKGEMNEKLYAELTAVKAERDAAGEVIKKFLRRDALRGVQKEG